MEIIETLLKSCHLLRPAYDEDDSANLDNLFQSKLIVEKNGEKIDQITLHSNGRSEVGLFCFGRNKSKVDVILKHNSISGQHAAVVVFVPLRSVFILDLNSRNGTFLNGSKIGANIPFSLVDEDTVKFGLSERKYKVFIRNGFKNPTRIQDELTLAMQGEVTHGTSEQSDKIMCISTKPLDASITPAETKVVSAFLNQGEFPFNERVELFSHKKALVSIAVDAAGSRLATGGNDFQLSMWDFGGMKSDFKPFKSFVAVEGHIINRLQYSQLTSKILVAANDSRCRIFNRDGELEDTTTSGDPYLQDMNKTKGHPSVITDACWHPVLPNIFLTSGWMELFGYGTVKRRTALCLITN